MKSIAAPVTSDPAAARRTLRATAIAAREALPEETREVLTGRLVAHLERLFDDLRPACVAFCWPWRGEADLRAWLAAWLDAAAERSAALPAVLDKNAPLTFRGWRPGMELAVDCHGIPYPAQGPAVRPDVVLVPLNAFDGEGYRLGYGGGYFDRTLAVLDTVAVGVGFECGRTGTVFPQPHDRPMDWLVTEAGVFAPRAAR
ncbi:5-formyltetrahydrofolate cyclo-ligase [Pseudothauera lacus]|uniref:5-formyltetrahydrofolate cyclo-ligase n=1 Tax=Pseudothauera lacus TaxID=2136175 RepID=A0A2T4IDX4_9RHOO|nr:5-formyltetrahydrofolate cyclo-ligase [Pseudothauera lacus]PTD95977.1 5-formyltetrahydrofolate cyclo-ligase [Pseudothauera lacus]